MPKWSWVKYKEIIFSVALFIVLDAGVLILNYYTSFQIANDAHAIELASRQSTLAEEMLHRLYQVRDDAQAGDAMPSSVDQLGKPFKQFDEVLDGFIHGVALIGRGLGQDALLTEADYSGVGGESLSNAQKIWQEYRGLVSNVVYSGFDDDMTAEDLLAATNKAIAYGRKNGSLLVDAVQNFAGSVEDRAQQKASRLRMFQMVGISLAIINFFIILFHFIRKLSRSDRAAESARRETEEILGTVNDGLFLLDCESKIGSQYSASLTRLFRQQNLAGRPFFDLLSSMVSGKVLDTAQEFVEVLFAEHVNAELMGDLNPLEQVELTLMQNDGRVATRIVSFRFTPVRENGELLHLLVTVDDITEQVELARELDQLRQENAREADLLLSAVHVQAERLDQLLGSANRSVRDINRILQTQGVRDEQLRSKVDSIFRIVHRLKGEAAAIELSILETRAHQFEELLIRLRNSENLSGNDFLPVTVALNHLSRDLIALQTLAERLDGVITRETAQSTDKKRLLQEELLTVAQQAAHQGGKDVELDMDQFDIDLLPANSREDIRAELIQLVRNAVVHGIETRGSRQLQGKPVAGVVQLLTERLGDSTRIIVRDDGRGIDLNTIRKRLIASGKWGHEQVSQFTPAELIRFLFSPGFSTADEENKLAGRGVGLDYVKQQAESRGGRLTLKAKRGQFTEFCMTVPVKETVAA